MFLTNMLVKLSDGHAKSISRVYLDTLRVDGSSVLAENRDQTTTTIGPFQSNAAAVQAWTSIFTGLQNGQLLVDLAGIPLA